MLPTPAVVVLPSFAPLPKNLVELLKVCAVAADQVSRPQKPHTPTRRRTVMTLTLPEAEESLFQAVFGSPADTQTVAHTDTQLLDTIDRLLAEMPVDAPPRFDIPDVRDAMTMLPADRVQPRFGDDGQIVPGMEGACRYAHPENGRPSCIGGAVIAYLAPVYFAFVSGHACSVPALTGIEQVFTQRAVALLHRMQHYADTGRTWGEAFLNASLDRLEAETSIA